MRFRERSILRLIELAEYLGDTYEGRPSHGWKSPVARRLGLDPSYLGRILHGQRQGIGARAMDSFCEVTGLEPDFFLSNEPVHRCWERRGRVRDTASRGTDDGSLRPGPEVAAIMALDALTSESRARVLRYAEARWSEP